MTLSFGTESLQSRSTRTCVNAMLLAASHIQIRRHCSLNLAGVFLSKIPHGGLTVITLKIRPKLNNSKSGGQNFFALKNHYLRWSTLVSIKTRDFLGFLRLHSTRHILSISIIIGIYSPSELITSRCVSLFSQPREQWSNFKVASESGPGQSYCLKSD